MTDRTWIAQYENVMEAEIAKSLLESNGITCWVENQHLGTIMPHASHALGWIKVGVDSENEEEARRILASQDLPAEKSNLKVNAPSFGILFKRASYGAVIGTIFFPVIANVFSISLYLQAYSLDHHSFRKHWKMFLIGTTFNFIGLVLIPYMFFLGWSGR